ncbi:MAG: DMT family transporter [Bacteroidia bacterium]
MSKVLKAHLAVLAANILYGINFSIAKEIMPKYIGPFGFIVLRVFTAALLFLLVHTFFIREKLERQDLFKLAKCALFGVAINQLLFFKGLSLTAPINAALVMCANPIQVLIIASIIWKEKIPFTKIFGIILGLTGAASIILFGKKFSMNDDTFIGDMMVFVNSLSYAYFIVIAKPLLKKYHPQTVMKYTFLFGSVMVLPFGYSQFMDIDWHNMPHDLYSKIAFVLIGTTFIAYMFNTFGLRYLSSSSVSVYIYSQPVFATLMSMYRGQGNPGWLHLFAAVMIFTGVYIASRPVEEKLVEPE